MKMKLYILTLAAALAACVSCDKFDDYSKNPYALYDVPAESFVQPILYNTEYGLVNSSRSVFSQLMQYTINVNTEITSRVVHNYAISEADTKAVWERLYLQAGNVETMLKIAREEENPAMVGVALVLKVFIYSTLTDIYGDIPYFNAAQLPTQDEVSEYKTPYDSQKDIYVDLLTCLEEANDAFVQADVLVQEETLTSADFSPMCDYTYRGDVEKWRRFGNTLYLRLLMRCSLKVEQDYGGVLTLNREYGDLDVKARIAELYDCWRTGSGAYPMIRSREEAALVPFSKTDASLHTPFFSTTSGTWGGVRACLTLTEPLTDNGSGVSDPRLLKYFAKKLGAPTQWLYQDLQDYMDAHFSSLGNSLVGRLPENIKNADHFALLNYSEELFCFAEAGARGWITMSFPTLRQLYIDAVTEAILEWNEDVTATSPEVTNYIAGLYTGIDGDNALSVILTQKWISLFFVGAEGWCDYRRSGYPILKTNGPAAENDCILPTRLRYPADELYRNEAAYTAALSGWLGGSNNMQTDVWWADTVESRKLRAKGRL